ncbi:SpoIIE family protein phosphatase [bacterium]|nr:SpoIIE family protein phosphatase [bacterium]
MTPQKKLSRSDLAVLVLTVTALALFFSIGRGLFPENMFQRGADKETILLKAQAVLEEMGYNFNDIVPAIQLDHDELQQRHLYTEFGSARAIALARDTIPVLFWRIRWRLDIARGDTVLQTLAPAGENSAAELLLDWNGEPLKFQVPAFMVRPGSSENEADDFSVALLLAQRVFRGDGSKWQFDRSEERGRGPLQVRRYTWRRETTAAGQVVDLTVDVRRGKVLKFEKRYPIPKQYTGSGDDNMGAFLLVLSAFILIILMIVYFIRRLRADQLDLKSGLLPALLAMAGTISWLIYGEFMSGGLTVNRLIADSVIALIFTGAVWGLYCVSDSLVREEWPEKLFTVDAMKRRILFPGTGLAIIRGIALACIGLGIVSVLGKAAVMFSDAYYPLSLMSSRLLFPSPFRLFILGELLFRAVFISVFFLFMVTLLRRWFKQTVWVLLPALLLFTSVSFGLPRVLPVWESMAVNAILGLLVTLFFIRYDFLTVFTALCALPLLYYGSMLCMGGAGFWLYGAVLLAVFVGGLMYALRAFQSDTSTEEIAGYVPDYMQRVYERERIQRELDIARHVQETFLPRKNPEIPQLDIASICRPAKEVGGDYFDFILGPDRLGVVIGDVSGKGISAAFYMTLTKGFFKSQTEIHTSPRDILINMNKLFYANAERGKFISMIIGVFNFDTGTLTFARAGHNPMILFRAETGLAEEVDVPGIALGLDSGRLFAKTIEERTVPYHPNDLFLFYTDGINEAKDTSRKEFGEERLMHIVETYHRLSAQKMLSRIEQSVDNFTAGTNQHDDITAVLVKIR